MERSKKENNSNQQQQKQAPKTISIVLLCWFFGFFGIHRLVLGYKNWWLMPVTLGGGSIWMLLDLYMLLNGALPMADGRKLR